MDFFFLTLVELLRYCRHRHHIYILLPTLSTANKLSVRNGVEGTLQSFCVTFGNF